MCAGPACGKGGREGGRARGQGCSALLAAKVSWEAAEHALLGFSFSWPPGSRLMALEGSHFAPLELPGFDKTRETLLLAGSLGGWLVQVTPQVSIPEIQPASLPAACPHFPHHLFEQTREAVQEEIESPPLPP